MPEDDGMISASEMSEFEFCSVSWYLDKEGYPRSGFSSQRMQRGIEMHRRVHTGYSRAGGAMKLLLVIFVVILVFVLYIYLGGNLP